MLTFRFCFTVGEPDSVLDSFQLRWKNQKLLKNRWNIFIAQECIAYTNSFRVSTLGRFFDLFIIVKTSSYGFW